MDKQQSAAEGISKDYINPMNKIPKTAKKPQASEVIDEGPGDQPPRLQAKPNIQSDIKVEKNIQEPKLALALAEAKKAASLLWRANLGAAALIEENATQIFNNLVDKGTALQNRTDGEGRVGRIGRKMGTAKQSMQDVKNKASGKIHSIEVKIDKKVKDTLNWIGLPNRYDIEDLTGRVNDLSSSVESMVDEIHKTITSKKTDH